MREDFGDDAKAVLEVLVQREPKTSRGEEATRGGGGWGGGGYTTDRTEPTQNHNLSSGVVFFPLCFLLFSSFSVKRLHRHLHGNWGIF